MRLSSIPERLPDPELFGFAFSKITAPSSGVARSALLNTTDPFDIIIIAASVPPVAPPALGGVRSRSTGLRLLPELDKSKIAMMQASEPQPLRDIGQTLIVLHTRYATDIILCSNEAGAAAG